VHGRKKWQYYYEPSNVERQRAFFDHFLRAPSTVVPAWPKVLIEVRERANVGAMRAEKQWPLARTEYRKLYLDANGAALREAPGAAAEARYDAKAGSAAFDYAFAEDTELTGHMKLHLNVEAVGSDDMDLFVAIQKVGADGALVPFVFYAMLENGPVALGWLRVSHRELDAKRSTEAQPVHTHEREQLLKTGERVGVDIEIWPSSTVFRAGERLRVVVQGHDVYQEGLPNAPFARHERTRNRGTHVIHTGGLESSGARDAGAGRSIASGTAAQAGGSAGGAAGGGDNGGATPSHLLIPVIPPS
jgi:predicted acyl esterase